MQLFIIITHERYVVPLYTMSQKIIVRDVIVENKYVVF